MHFKPPSKPSKDTLLAAIFTILVPSISNFFAKKTGNPKILFWVTSGAALLW